MPSDLRRQEVLQDRKVLLHHHVVLSQKTPNQEVHLALAPRNALLVLTGERQSKSA